MTSYWLWGVLIWLCCAVAVVAARHHRRVLALWREPVFGCPVLIVESDDWGVGPVTDGEALANLAAVLARHVDANGHSAVMTLGVVSGDADGPAILARDCREYVRQTLDQAEFAPIVSAIRAGVARGVFTVQWHGLEHFWPAALLARAQGDETLRAWLAKPSARSEALPSELQSRWIDCSALPSRPLPPGAIASAIGEEGDVLARVFGAVPAVAVPNTFVWCDAVERAWGANGVRCIVTPGRRYEARDASGKLAAPTRHLVNGQRSAGGAVYVVRDAYFEPARGHRAERVWDALARKTRLGRPVLLETHRDNFIEDAEKVAGALAELDRALAGALARFPLLRFITTEALAAEMTKPDSAIRIHAPAARIPFFVRRVLDDGELRRLLRLTGLAWIVRGVEKITRS